MSSLDEHLLPRMVASGLAVTINTDVPSVTGRTLTEEYAAAFEVSDNDLAGFARAAVDASFAPTATKSRLHGEISAWLGATYVSLPRDPG